MGDTIKGYPSRSNEDRTGQLLSTFNKLNQFEAGQAGYSFVIKTVSTLTVSSASLTQIITTASHNAREGDVIRFSTGTADNIDVEAVVQDIVDSTTFTLAQTLITLPVATDTFVLYRPIREVQGSSGAGNATLAEQQAQTALLTDIETNTTGLSDVATETTLSALNSKVAVVNTAAVVISSSALPTGASTSALQTTGNTSLSSIDGKITACNTGAVVISSALPAGTNAIGGVYSAPSSSSSFAPSRSVSTALEASRLAKASAGNLYTITGHNFKTSSQYILVFNNSSLPADGAGTIIYPFLVPASSNFCLDFGTLGEHFSVGIVVCNSSTLATKTIGSADCWFTVRYS